MKRSNIVAVLGMLVPPSIAIGFYIYIGSYNRMLADDYCSIYIGERLGLFRSIWYWYRSWHGGFSASAADWVLSFFGPGMLPFATFVFLSTWLVVAIIAVKKALHFRGYLSSKLFVALLLGVFLVFTTLSLSPDILQSLFWWGGARGYLSPLILFTLYFALYYHFIASYLNRIHISRWLFASFGFAFLIGGFSETFTPVLVVFLAGMVGIRWLASKFNVKDSSTLFLSAGFAGALLSLLVMVFAPGNSIRQEYFPAPPDLSTILKIAFVSYLTFLHDIFSSPYTLTGLLGSTLGAVWLGTRIDRESGVAPLRGWWILAVVLAGFVLAFGCFPPAVYGTSESPAPRTLITPSFILVICFLTSGFVFGEWLINRNGKIVVLSHALLIIACSSIIFSSYGSFQNLYSMRDEHISFAQQWDQVDSKIREAKKSGLQQVHIPPMENWAGIEYPTNNPKYWPNICYSKYYGINVLAPP